jgi:ubiquitin C-terminal hydrolase
MKGLENIGNTCSINTLVQCLGHARAIREALFSKKAAKRPNKRWVISNELRSLLQDLWVRKQDVRPERFVGILHDAFSGIIQRGEQHDLCELAVYMCDAILEEHGNTEYTANCLPQADSSQGRGLVALSAKIAETWERFHKNGFSQWNSILEGLQVSQVQCGKCGYACHSYEPFSQLTLDITEGAQSIPECLHKFFCAEKLTEWKCDKCKVVQEAERVVRFWMLPRVLFVSLKRFSFSPSKGTMQKVSAPIKITEHITFMSNSIIGPNRAPQSYKLVSAGLHHGSPTFGHYTALGRLEDDTWAHYDDMDIRQVDASFMDRNKDAYLLVYERL